MKFELLGLKRYDLRATLRSLEATSGEWVRFDDVRAAIAAASEGAAPAAPLPEPVEFKTWWDSSAHPFFLEDEARLTWNYSRAALMDRLEYLESELAKEAAAPLPGAQPAQPDRDAERWRFLEKNWHSCVGNRRLPEWISANTLRMGGVTATVDAAMEYAQPAQEGDAD